MKTFDSDSVYTHNYARSDPLMQPPVIHERKYAYKCVYSCVDGNVREEGYYCEIILNI